MIHRYDELHSTSTAMAAMAASLGHGDVIIARTQTAGRGQRGNSWEAEPGANLTFSLMLRQLPVPPAQAFVVSMAVSLAIARVLSDSLGHKPVLIKWPNDIYVGDRKLCGILIENSFSGRSIERSIVGIGINVNQTHFISDAPNPVSLAQIAGHAYDLDSLLERVVNAILDELQAYADSPDINSITDRYRALQWRGTGRHRWHDNLTDEDITAAIASISPDGTLTLDTHPPRSYAFKEITAIL